MRVILYALIGIALCILESALLGAFPVEFFKPDLSLPLILYTTIFSPDPVAGLILSVVLGMTQEVFSSAPHGTIVLTKLLVFLVALFLKKKLYIDSRYSFAYVSGAFVLAETFIYLLLSFLARGETRNILNLLIYAIPNAVFTGFIAIFLLPLVLFINAKLFERD